MRNLDHSIAWITGGGSGIGQAGAVALAQAGATVIVSGRRREPLAETVKRITDAGGKADFETLDIGDKAACERAASNIIKRHGKVDILVNNAATNIPKRHWNDMNEIIISPADNRWYENNREMSA